MRKKNSSLFCARHASIGEDLEIEIDFIYEVKLGRTGKRQHSCQRLKSVRYLIELLDMQDAAVIANVEKNTAKLYSDCFDRLNQWTDDSWLRQGEMLFQNIGLSDEIVQGKKCLDGGCGHGTLSYQLLKHGASEVWGVDLHRTYKELMLTDKPNFHFLQASLLDVPIEDNTFDLVASNGVLHHTADPEKAFKEFVRITKPGGRIVVGVYGKHGLFPYCLSLMRLVTVKRPIIPEGLTRWVIDKLAISPMVRYQILDYVYVPRLERFSPKEMRSLFESNGLKDVKPIFGLTPEQAKHFRDHKTVYTYDTTTISSRILFGHGFQVFQGVKK